MAIKIIEGKVNISGEIRGVGAKIQLSEAEEKRLVDLGFAEVIDEDDEIEVIEEKKAKSK